MISRSTKNTRNRAMLFILGVDEIKGKVLSNLKVHAPGPGYSHFPLSPDLDEEHRRGYTDEYFRGLVSERRILKFKKGFKRYEWIKESGVRNEPLDCRVYARAALGILNPNFETLRKLMEKKKMKETPQAKASRQAAQSQTSPPSVILAPKTPKRRRGSKGISV
jgi:phage terminase large subunit GpA-like protein